MSKVKNLSGMKFGRLTAVEFVGVNKKHESLWSCKCDCGNVKVVVGCKLTGGYTRSCGCLNRETAQNLFRKHGMRNSRIYNCWRGMNQRCHNSSAPAYRNYGGRGISVCDEWRNSFEAFYAWSMKNGYTDQLTIERIDVNGGYCPENCCWANMKVQQNNRTNNRIVSFSGKTQTVMQWADEVGVKAGTLYYRLNQGWSVADALQTPVYGRSTYA